MYEKERKVKGEITAFLSLIFILLISFIGALLEGASIQIEKNNRRGEMDRAMYSVFAEYQKQLQKNYKIFALEGTYETGKFDEQIILERLDHYGGSTMEHRLSKVQLLTDENGMPFQEQVIRYMEHKLGIEIIKDIARNTNVWQEHSTKGKDYIEQEKTIEESLQSEIEASGEELPVDGNPLKAVSDIKQVGLLKFVVPEEEHLSKRKIELQSQPSQRPLEKGYGSFPIWEGTKGVDAKIFMNEYLLESFGVATDKEEKGALAYEVEYLLEGKASDQENLEGVVKKLLLMRMGANYGYLLTDQEKQLEASAMALTLSTAIALPILSEVLKQAILSAWAFGESIMDIRSLLNDKRVPLIKTRESWQLQLENLAKIGTQEDEQKGGDFTKGQTYKEYLRILLFLEDAEACRKRALDIIEGNVQRELGLPSFKVDQCISKMEVYNRGTIRKGITYEFPNYYGYQ